MKVVIAHNRYSSAQPSGENTIVDTEIKQLIDAGVEVIDFQRSSDEISHLPRKEKLLLPISPIYASRAQQELAKILDTERPDVLHLHNPYPLLSPWVIKTAHRHGVPVVHTVHNYRQVCANGLYFRDGHVCTDCLGKAFAYPAVRHSCYRGSTAQSLIMASTLAVHRRTWREVDQYIALTPAIAEHLQTLGIREDQITIKPNSIPDPGEPPAPRPTEAAPSSGSAIPTPRGSHSQPADPVDDSSGSSFVPDGVEPAGILFVGRLTEEKGIGLLLDAWARSGTGTLTIIGDGPLRDRVVQTAAERPDVDYRGSVAPTAVQNAMRSATALVVPSTWRDPLPTVIIESLALGRPVLGTAMGGIPYLIGDAGWVVEPTVDALAAALPIAAVGGLQTQARSRYRENFTPEVVLNRLLAVYERVCRR